MLTLKEMNLETKSLYKAFFNRNRLFKFIILIIEMSFAYLTLFSNIKLHCIFKTIFNIPCPVCGLTRAFKSIIKLDLIGAFHYNALSVIIFVLLLVFNIYLIYDIVMNKKKTDQFINNLGKNYILIIIILLINGIINIMRGL